MADTKKRGKEDPFKLVGLSATLALALSRKSLAPTLQLSKPLMRRTLAAATHQRQRQRMLASSGSVHLPRIVCTGHFSTSTLPGIPEADLEARRKAQASDNQQTCERLRAILKEEWGADLEARRKTAQVQASENRQIFKHLDFGGPYDICPFYLNGEGTDYEAFYDPTKLQDESKNQGGATKLRSGEKLST